MKFKVCCSFWGVDCDLAKYSTSNEEMTKDTEGTVEIGNSKRSCDQVIGNLPT